MPHAGRQGATRSLETSDGDGSSSTSRCTLASSGQTPAASRVQLISQSVVLGAGPPGSGNGRKATLPSPRPEDGAIREERQIKVWRGETAAR